MSERWELASGKIFVEIDGGTLNYCPLDATPARDTALSTAVQSAVRELEEAGQTRRAGGELVIERECGRGHKWRRVVRAMSPM